MIDGVVGCFVEFIVLKPDPDFLVFVVHRFTSCLCCVSVWASARARFPTMKDFVMNSISCASSGLETCPTIIMGCHSLGISLSVVFKRTCCTGGIRCMYGCYRNQMSSDYGFLHKMFK